MTYLAAALSGFLLFASDHPLHCWWLQFVALLPFWWSLAAQRDRHRAWWPLGLLAAAANVLPLVLTTGPSPPIVAAAIVLVLQWLLVAMVAGRCLGCGEVLGPLAAAAALTVSEVLIWYAAPIFGTAQCFVRPLSAAPALTAFVAYTGIGGLAFVLAACQALLVTAVRARRLTPLVIAAAIVAAVTVADVARWQRPTGAMVRVAAHGWTEFPGEPKDALDVYRRSLAKAAAAGARLLVTPEAAADVDVVGYWLGARESAIRGLGAEVRARGISAAIGVFQNSTNDNRVWMFAADGTLAGEYRKSHLIPWLENYVAGDGTTVTADVDALTFGAMICQDDNFTDLARAYGRAGVPLLAVPSNDWPAIREFHLENGIFRAIENGYAVVRAVSNGISALIDCRGIVVARHDHVDAGEAMLIDEVAIGDGVPTLYARFGDWPIALWCGLLLVLAFARRAPSAPA